MLWLGSRRIYSPAPRSSVCWLLLNLLRSGDLIDGYYSTEAFLIHTVQHRRFSNRCPVGFVPGVDGVIPNTGATLQGRISQGISMRATDTTASPSSSSSSALEVEQKFTLTLDTDADNVNENQDAVSRMEDRLQQLGLQSKGSFTLIDWYFDVEPNWPLTTRDCWLRYRQVIFPTNTADDNQTIDPPKLRPPQGSWQLKVGKSRFPDTSHDIPAHTASATLYEELEGDTAVDTAIAMLVKQGDDPSIQPSYQQHVDGSLKDAPQVPEPSYGLVPFAKIESKRSSWTVPATPTSSSDIASDAGSSLMDLSVDLDVTTFGYAVGEVETVVNHESQVAEAQARIQQFLTQLLETASGKTNHKNTTTTVGKLEYYLTKHRPEHYQACIQSGSLTTPN